MDATGSRKYHILNVDQLYTTQYRMPRFYRIGDQAFEYVNSKWKKISGSVENSLEAVSPGLEAH